MNNQRSHVHVLHKVKGRGKRERERERERERVSNVFIFKQEANSLINFFLTKENRILYSL